MTDGRNDRQPKSNIDPTFSKRGYNKILFFYEDSYIEAWLNWTYYGPRREKNCLRGFANNTGPDQRSLISAFVICFLESFICKLATGEISIF